MNIAVLSMVALAASSCLTGGFSPTSKDPTVWLDSDKQDWGKIGGNDTVEHVFKVRNSGGAPLNIARVQTSCGCTAAVLDHQFLKPGEETRLKVTFDPRGKHGAQTRTIWIHSNDPKFPQKQIVIQADIADTMPQATAFPTPQGGPVSGTMMTPSMSGTLATGSAAPMSSTTAAMAPAPAAAPVMAPAATAPAPVAATPAKTTTPAPKK